TGVQTCALPIFPLRMVSSATRSRGMPAASNLAPKIDARGEMTTRRPRALAARRQAWTDRKSTRLNSSHVKISYAVFCLKKKKLAGGATGVRRVADGAGP